ncbi:MAG: hypothetical protein SFX73_36585, partial [Kofleriaceae bacterium]|nr:hypothetical protein [Kofleriaceae bacterium]
TVDAPKGTTVTNLTSKTGFGAVGNIVLPGSLTPVQLQFSLKGHRDVIVDVVPNADQVFKPTFLKGSGTTRQPVAGSSPVTTPTTPTTPTTQTPTEPANKPPTEPVKPPTEPVKPPPEDDCPELPCLKDPLKANPGGG